MVNAILNGAHVGLCIVAAWVLGGVLLDVLRSPRTPPQILSHAWNSRPWRALSRERQNRTPGPGN